MKREGLSSGAKLRGKEVRKRMNIRGQLTPFFNGNRGSCGATVSCLIGTAYSSLG